MVSKRSGKSVCALLCLSECTPGLSLRRCQLEEEHNNNNINTNNNNNNKHTKDGGQTLSCLHMRIPEGTQTEIYWSFCNDRTW